MIKYSPSVSCDMNNVTGINTIVKTCSVKITAIASKFKDTCINWLNIFIFLFRYKPPLSTDVFEFVNIPISCIDTTYLYDVGESNSHSLRFIAKCSTLAYENKPLLESWDMKMQIIHMCQETLRHLDIWLPLLFWTNTSTPSELSTQKDIVIWILWSSLIFSILRAISHNFQFNSSTEGSISKFLFEIAHSASSSTDVDAPKFWLVQYDIFYGGEKQDTSDCLMMLV